MTLPLTFDDPHSYKHGIGDTEAARLTLARIRAYTSVSAARFAYEKTTATARRRVGVSQ